MDTTQLLNDLYQAESLEEFFNAHEDEFHTSSFSQLLVELAERKGLRAADVARESGQGEYVYKVFQGKRKPSRDIILAMALGMKLTYDETQLLLRVAKMAGLDPRDRRDSVILYGMRENLSTAKINDLLYEMQEKTL